MGSCKLCGYQFTPKSMRLTLSVKRDWYIEKIRVCMTCHERELAKDE